MKNNTTEQETLFLKLVRDLNDIRSSLNLSTAETHIVYDKLFGVPNEAPPSAEAGSGKQSEIKGEIQKLYRAHNRLRTALNSSVEISSRLNKRLQEPLKN